MHPKKGLTTQEQSGKDKSLFENLFIIPLRLKKLIPGDDHLLDFHK